MHRSVVVVHLAQEKAHVELHGTMHDSDRSHVWERLPSHSMHASPQKGGRAAHSMIVV